jgi:hypothetical protein
MRPHHEVETFKKQIQNPASTHTRELTWFIKSCKRSPSGVYSLSSRNMAGNEPGDLLLISFSGWFLRT